MIGGGFIGSEIAAALRMQGREVTMIVQEDGIGARVFPAELSRCLVGLLPREGRRPCCSGRRVDRVRARDGQFQVRSAKGAPLDGGCRRRRARDRAQRGAGPRRPDSRSSDGIEVDEQLRTSRPEIYAAGDVANFHNPALGKRIRVEHEDNANTMGAGRRPEHGRRRPRRTTTCRSSTPTSSTWATRRSGELDARHQTVADWKEPFREGVIYYLEDGRVRGVLLWNTWGQVDAARALIAEPGPFRPEELKGRLPAA